MDPASPRNPRVKQGPRLSTAREPEAAHRLGPVSAEQGVAETEGTQSKAGSEPPVHSGPAGEARRLVAISEGQRPVQRFLEAAEMRLAAPKRRRDRLDVGGSG